MIYTVSYGEGIGAGEPVRLSHLDLPLFRDGFWEEIANKMAHIARQHGVKEPEG